MVNTYGLKMTDLRKAAGETKDLPGYYSGQYLQVNYDINIGEVFTDYHCSLGQNWWTQYDDDNIINCGNISDPSTMQDIADRVQETMLWKKELQSMCE